MSGCQQRYELIHGGDTEAMRAELERIKAAGKPVVLVSACLLGVRCRYDGHDKRDDAAVARAAGGDAEILPVCPEVLARLGVPRPAITLSADGKQATDARGRDVTAELEAGVRLAESDRARERRRARAAQGAQPLVRRHRGVRARRRARRPGALRDAPRQARPADRERTRYLNVPEPLTTKLPMAAPDPRSIGTAKKRTL